MEDGLKKLDKLTNEEVAMASAQLLKVAHNINTKVTGVDERVQVVKGEVQLINDKVQTIADGGEHLFGKSPASSLIFII